MWLPDVCRQVYKSTQEGRIWEGIFPEGPKPAPPRFAAPLRWRGQSRRPPPPRGSLSLSLCVCVSPPQQPAQPHFWRRGRLASPPRRDGRRAGEGPHPPAFRERRQRVSPPPPPHPRCPPAPAAAASLPPPPAPRDAAALTAARCHSPCHCHSHFRRYYQL